MTETTAVGEERPTDSPAALFERDGHVWHPQLASVGPWSPEALHGGPVAALCVSVVEELLPDDDLVTTRMTLDLVRPVPTRPLEVRAEIVKQGRRVHLARVEILDEGQVAAWATVQRTKRHPVELPPLANTGVELQPPPDLPEQFAPFDSSSTPRIPAPFLRLGTELRTPQTNAIYAARTTEAWIRVFAHLTPGVPLSTSAAVYAAADYGNALGAPEPPGLGMLFPNADLTVHLARTPESAWVRLAPRSTWLESGIGQTSCALSDVLGLLGTSIVTLAMANRPPATPQ